MTPKGQTAPGERRTYDKGGLQSKNRTLLNEFRKKSGMSGRAMAKSVGISTSYFSEILNGTKLPKDPVLITNFWLVYRLPGHDWGLAFDDTAEGFATSGHNSPPADRQGTSGELSSLGQDEAAKTAAAQ